MSMIGIDSGISFKEMFVSFFATIFTMLTFEYNMFFSIPAAICFCWLTYRLGFNAGDMWRLKHFDTWSVVGGDRFYDYEVHTTSIPSLYKESYEGQKSTGLENALRDCKVFLQRDRRKKGDFAHIVYNPPDDDKKLTSKRGQ